MILPGSQGWHRSLGYLLHPCGSRCGAGIKVSTLFPGSNHSHFHSADLHFRERKMP